MKGRRSSLRRALATQLLLASLMRRSRPTSSILLYGLAILPYLNGGRFAMVILRGVSAGGQAVRSSSSLLTISIA